MVTVCGPARVPALFMLQHNTRCYFGCSYRSAGINHPFPPSLVWCLWGREARVKPASTPVPSDSWLLIPFFFFQSHSLALHKRLCITLRSCWRTSQELMPTLLSPQGNEGCPSFLTHFSIFLISTLCFCGQTTESRVNFVILRQPGVQLGEPVEDGSTSNSSSSSNGGSPVHHRRRPDQNHYRRKSNYQKVGLGNEAKMLLILGLVVVV